MFDPSKLNPQAINEISELMRLLTPEQMMKMQTLMHNQMGGFDVTKEMMAFEQSLPPSFREKMARIMYIANGIEVPAQASTAIPAGPVTPLQDPLQDPSNENEARLVILRSVAGGLMSPEEALKVLFS
jgi:Spy/CpxP family protein refolding chaperone